VAAPTRLYCGRGFRLSHHGFNRPRLLVAAQPALQSAKAGQHAGEPEAIRHGLVVKGIPGIERQTQIGIAEAGEQGVVLAGVPVSV
jgi:hypothetical protein